MMSGQASLTCELILVYIIEWGADESGVCSTLMVSPLSRRLSLEQA